MSEREIDIDKVLDCIIRGKTIEFQTDRRTNDIKFYFRKQQLISQRYTVVAALETPLIITLCRTKKRFGNLLIMFCEEGRDINYE